MSPNVIDYGRPQAEYRLSSLSNGMKVVFGFAVFFFVAGFLLLQLASPAVAVNRYRGLASIPIYGWDFRAAWPFYGLCYFVVSAAERALSSPDVACGLRRVRFGLLTGMGICLYFMATPLIGPLSDGHGDAYFCSLLVLLMVTGNIWAGWQISYRAALRWMPGHSSVGSVLGTIAVVWTVILATAVPAMGNSGGFFSILAASVVMVLTPILPFVAFSYLLGDLDRRVTSRPMGIKRLAAGAVGSAVFVNWTLAYLLHESIGASGRPLCYVATAAARGHRWLVRTRRELVAGLDLELNDQLRALIGAEVLLRYRHPRLARAFRRMYDAIGPALAARIHRPLQADMAYLAIKPMEWLARLYLIRHGVRKRDSA